VLSSFILGHGDAIRGLFYACMLDNWLLERFVPDGLPDRMEKGWHYAL
jgi:hypothetical protein